MARRSDIDWEAIEADYRAGALSERKVAEKHGVSYSTLRGKIKAEGWTRDLSRMVEHATKAAMIEKAKKDAERAAQSAQAEQSAQGIGAEIGARCADKVISGVQATANQRVAVLTRHQEAARAGADLAASIINELVQVSNQKADLEALAAAIEKGDNDVAAAEIRKMTSVGSRAATLKTAIEALGKAIDKEREAHGIKPEEEGGKGQAELEAHLFALNERLMAERSAAKAG